MLVFPLEMKLKDLKEFFLQFEQLKKLLKWNDESNLSHSSNWVITVINASAAVTLLEQRPEKIQALSGILTHDLCDAGAVLSQLSYQSHMRAVIYGLALYMETLWLGPSTVKMKVICPIVAIEW